MGSISDYQDKPSKDSYSFKEKTGKTAKIKAEETHIINEIVCKILLENDSCLPILKKRKYTSLVSDIMKSQHTKGLGYQMIKRLARKLRLMPKDPLASPLKCYKIAVKTLHAYTEMMNSRETRNKKNTLIKVSHLGTIAPFTVSKTGKLFVHINKTLGHGTSKTVKESYVPEEDTSFAHIITDRLDEERSILRKLQGCPYIISDFEVVVPEDDKVHAHQKLYNSFEDLVKSGSLDANDMKKVISNVATGLDHMHTHEDEFVHCDIKPGNIMVDEEGSYVITDFGSTVSVGEDLSSTSTGFCPPESYAPNYKADPKFDSFSLGILICTMLKKNCTTLPKLPFEDVNLYLNAYKQLTDPEEKREIKKTIDSLLEKNVGKAEKAIQEYVIAIQEEIDQGDLTRKI